ncbi:lytic transglycosylase domain-containing protein [Ascidiaceihabitans sp.]|uniref:lytic transglycosylase domain-containing protein n=1 Tax=Ascidiaceihabitans sp. TaxID=1872644 RepID=UPI003298A05C
MQVIPRVILCLTMIFTLTLPALAERPRPLGWAMDAMRSGNWDEAAKIAARDGQVASDVIMWHRLRAGRGTYTQLADFLDRRPDWPGEAFLLRRSEPAVLQEGPQAVAAFFADHTPQTPRGVLAYAQSLKLRGQNESADALLVSAWTRLRMNADSQALFLATHGAALKPHHWTRLDAMLWDGAGSDARRMLDLVTDDQAQLARARLALKNRTEDASDLVQALPDSVTSDPGLAYDRFVWRARSGLRDSARSLLLAQSKSFKTLGNPQEWSNRRRSLAREEMRDGNPALAYRMAAQHQLTTGSAFADLEWLAGYIALRRLNDPETALTHFDRFETAIASPISKGRAGYWRGRAFEAMGASEKAAAAYANAALYQSSFYGLLAAERGKLPFDTSLGGTEVFPDWRTSDLVRHPLFEAGMLLQASGELDVAERFWTHYAEDLTRPQAAQLGQAAIDMDQPHIAVMIGKRVAQRGIILPTPYYALHPLAQRDLPMAPEMNLAIARRESEFDPSVQSGVGARGLMQIMPATAKEVAGKLGRSAEHSTDRLISDPNYNADLGAAFLSTLAGRFDGNVVLMSAAYNAGPSRPTRWIGLYGDPRANAEGFDVVDWIEHIPFRETRNYVMRVTESLPIYRARLGQAPLPQSFTQELIGSTLLPFAPKSE